MDFQFKTERSSTYFGRLGIGQVFISQKTFPGEPCFSIAGEDMVEAVHLLSGEVFCPDYFEQVIPYHATLVLK